MIASVHLRPENIYKLGSKLYVILFITRLNSNSEHISLVMGHAATRNWAQDVVC